MDAEHSKRPNVILIGAGITGLATAFCLRKAGIGVRVLEKRQAVGGTMRTIRQDGFLIDTGPNSALETTPLIRTMLSDLGISDEQVYANPIAINRYILRGGTLHPLPMNPLSFLRTRLFSTKAKLRLFLEPFIPPKAGDIEESVAEFVRRRIGKEFLDYAINPFIAGVYAGNPKNLSVVHAVKKVYALEQEYGSLIKGAILGSRKRKKSRNTSKHVAKLFSFKNGMEDYPTALQKALGDSVVTSASVRSIAKGEESGKYSVSYLSGGEERQETADAVFLGIPAYDTADYIHSFSPELSTTLKGIPYARVAMVFIGASRDQCTHPLDGFGFLVPEIEQRKILGTIWSSSLFPNRAPEGQVALTTFVGGMRQPELLDTDDTQLINIVKKELGQLIGLNGEPSLTYVKRWEKAIPQYVMGHGRILAELNEFENKFSGLFIGGNFRHGIGVGDCIEQSYKMADRIQEHLKIRG